MRKNKKKPPKLKSLSRLFMMAAAAGVLFGFLPVFLSDRNPPPPPEPAPLALMPLPVVQTPPPPPKSSPAQPPTVAVEKKPPPPVVVEKKPPPQPTPDPNAKKESTKRSRVLFAAGKNLYGLGKNEGAIHFYRQTVMECRGTPESDKAITRLVALKGKVPSISESVPPKESDPFAMPKPKRPRYASTEAYGQEFDQMLGQAMQSTIDASNRPASSGAASGGGGSHLCGAVNRDGSSCKNRVSGPGPCYLHGG
jgi:hypothetical protein